MKKFIACFLLMLVLIPVGICESVDVESLSDDELESMVQSLHEEMVSRGIVRELEEGEIEIGTGSYVVGKDIAPGRYDLSLIGGADYFLLIEKHEGASDQYWDLVDEYDSAMAQYDAGVIEDKPVSPDSEDYFWKDYGGRSRMTIELIEGQVMSIDCDCRYPYQKVTIKKSTGLFMDE